MSLYWLIPLCIVSYFIGNVNFSVIFSRRVLKEDIRTKASGNPGAGNMLRNFGFKWGVLILILDGLKGAIPTLIAYYLYDGTMSGGFLNSHIALFSCGISAVVGHVFPIIYKFKGGKGIATTMGVFFVASPLVSLFVLLGSILYLAIFEYSAICSFLFVTVMTIWLSIKYASDAEISIAVHSLLAAFYFFSWYTHRANILRLLIGKENTSSLFRSYKLRSLRKKHKKWIEELKKEKKGEENGKENGGN